MEIDKFVIGGLIIAIVIAILAPFIASSNPDGLDSTLETIEASGFIPEDTLQFMEEGIGYNAPLPDYIVPALGEDGLSGSLAIVIGVIIAFAAIVIVGKVISKKD